MPAPEPDRTAPHVARPDTTADHAAGPDDTGKPSSATAPGLDPPPVPPGYEILGELGRGGMGVVYKARQVKLNRLVALKMILAGRVGGDDLARFLAEAAAAAAVKHPNVVQVHECGEAHGRPYMALEFLPGGPLSRALAGDHPSPRSSASCHDAARLVARIARGVAAAHARGIVHRDLKPGNVLLDENGVPKVADFGLAKYGADVTATGVVMGTPAYMSPEQAKGESKFVGPPADVWALGVILYECLTGQRPFRGGAEAVLAQVLAADPVPPRKLAPAVPRDLELVCLKCLAKDPRDRYPTAAELADDLDRFLRGEPISVRPAGPIERGYKWARRNKAAAAALATAAIGVVVFAGWLVTLSQNKKLQQQTKGEAEGREKAEAGAADEARRRREAEERKRIEEEKRQQAEQAQAEAQKRERNAEYFAQLDRTARQMKKGPNGGLKLLSDPACPEDLREVTWHVLHRLARPPYLTLKDQPGSVIAASPDGRTLAVAGGGAKFAVRLLDLETGAERRTLAGHTAAVVALAYTADGRTLASAGADGSVRLWDPATGETRRTVEAIPGGVGTAAVSPDGRWLAAVKSGHPFAEKNPTPIRLWDLRTEGEPAELAGHDRAVSALAFAPDGKTLASASSDGTVRLWEPGRAQPRTTLKHARWVTSVAFAPDGKTLAAGNADGVVKVWAVTGEDVRSWETNAAGIYAVAFAPVGATLATAHEGGSLTANQVKLWDPKAGTELDGLNVAKSRLLGVAFAPNGKALVAVDEARTVTAWRMNEAEEAVGAAAHVRGYAVAYNPAGDTIATGGVSLLGGEVRLWDAKTGRPGRTLRHGVRVLAVAFSPDGGVLASGANDGSVKLWDAKTGAARGSVAGHTKEVRCVAFAHARPLAASAGLDHDVRVWDPADGRELFCLKGHGKAVMAVAFSPDDRFLATGGHDNTVRVWDLSNGREVAKWDAGPTGPVFGLAYSPDGKELYSGGASAVRCLSVADGSVLRTNPGHPQLFTMALSPAGRTLATGSTDGVVKLWDAAGLRDILTLTTDGNDLKGLAFSPDGLALAGMGTDGKLRIWR